MSAKSSVKRAQRKSMEGWDNLHPGMIPCYRDKKRHAKWRYGKKKGARRASRRVAKKQIETELEE